ncbi:SRPBCC family protein [Agrobacterium tumefaciens]|uniref:SRPBCC family protein n=1 Tax=Agrobacterium tumefaciens TaxID=358 RepID=UPI0012B9678E|nr:SRPBCC family protein [Agrobacterium tumefaciens]MQB07300.1 SRPBCC family protein [Agrobacterium tumefaciens]
MAKAYTSWIIDAPVQRVWEVVRDFNGLPKWNPGIAECEIEDGFPSDLVGCVRSLKLADGSPGRERLLALDDRRHHLMYNFELPPLPLENYIGQIDLKSLSDGGETLAIWQSTYDERPEDQGRFKNILENDVFAAGFRSLSAKLAGEAISTKAALGQVWTPGKIYQTAIIDAPIADAWRVVRGFAGVGEWYSDLLGDIPVFGRKGQVGEQRTFTLGGALQATETLISLSDHGYRLEYSVRHGSSAFLDYEGAVELHPVTMDDTALLIWTLDWRGTDVTPDATLHTVALRHALAILKNRIVADS